MRFLKRLLIVALILNVFNAFCQESDTVKQKGKNTWFVKVDLPNLAISADKSYMDCNVLQGYGVGFEYVMEDRIAVGCNIFRENSDVRFPSEQSYQMSRGIRFTPSFKLYLDSYRKLSVDIGTGIRFCHEAQGIAQEERENSYWQASLRFGAGYKMYLFKNRRFGVEASVGSNLVLWGDSEPWTHALMGRGMYMEVGFFYKLKSKGGKP